MSQIVLFYKYISILDPSNEKKQHQTIAKLLDLKGRLIIASEGLNGTFEGSAKSIKTYWEWLRGRSGFEDIHLKFSEGTEKSFPKLSIKVRSEIVSSHLGPKDLDPNKITGKYITAPELHAWLNSDKEFYIVDMRNSYEHLVGHFEGSILPEFNNFRDLEKVLPKISHLKNKTVVTVCTGGIRCEKASGFLVQNGFADVFQLYGGIVTYMEAYPNQHFKGKLYVFDNRITMGFNVNAPEHEVIGKCQKCGSTSENYVNCSFVECHKHFICCENCQHESGKAHCDNQCLYGDIYPIKSFNFQLALKK